MNSQISTCVFLRDCLAELVLGNDSGRTVFDPCLNVRYKVHCPGADLGILVWRGCSTAVCIAHGKNIGHACFQ